MIKDIINWVSENLVAVVIILIAGFVLIAFSLGKGFFNKNVASASNMSNKANAQKYAMYDNSTVTGSDVITALNSDLETGFTISVKTTGGTSTTYTVSSVYNVTDPSNANYIEPTGSFKSVLTKNSNGTVTSITFTQQ